MIINEFDINKLDEIVSSGIVLLDFYADWCGPCKMLSPELEIVAKTINEIKIYKINVDNNPEIARKYGIMSIPTLVLYKDGTLVKKNMGYIPSSDLEEWIKDA